MLVLSRKKKEQIIITGGGERIVITVTEMRGDKVKIGIEAPTTWSVHRSEVQDKLDEEMSDD